MLDEHEFLSAPGAFSYFDLNGVKQNIGLNAGSLAYTICQVPVILKQADRNSITVHYADGSSQRVEGHILDSVNSQHIFKRDGAIRHLIVSVVST